MQRLIPLCTPVLGGTVKGVGGDVMAMMHCSVMCAWAPCHSDYNYTGTCCTRLPPCRKGRKRSRLKFGFGRTRKNDAEIASLIVAISAACHRKLSIVCGLAPMSQLHCDGMFITRIVIIVCDFPPTFFIPVHSPTSMS